jgi:hypothetical protein
LLLKRFFTRGVKGARSGFNFVSTRKGRRKPLATPDIVFADVPL